MVEIIDVTNHMYSTCNVMYYSTVLFCSSIGGLTSPGLGTMLDNLPMPCVYIGFHTYILCM